MKKSTRKVNVERPPFLLRVKFALGTDTCSMHVRDCHWLRLRESPTNNIFFPFNLLNKSWPLNLHDRRQYIILNDQKSYNDVLMHRWLKHETLERES